MVKVNSDAVKSLKHLHFVVLRVRIYSPLCSPSKASFNNDNEKLIILTRKAVLSQPLSRKLGRIPTE